MINQINFVQYFILINLILKISGQHQIRFKVIEECPIKTIVGNIHLEVFKHDSRNQEHYTYKPSKKIDPFGIDPKTHNLYVAKRLDRESICKYERNDLENNFLPRNCEVTMQIYQRKIDDDLSNFSIMVYTIIVEILDINDNSPKWPNSRIHLDLAEHSKSDTKLALALALDPDQPPMNTTKEYNISHQSISAGFILKHLNPGNSKEALWLVVNKDFNREAQATISVKVDAYDGGPIPLVGHLEINISLTDINDCLPKFLTKNMRKTIEENIPLSTKILKLEATDEDEINKQSLIYQFDNSVDEDVRNRFSINPNTGEIYTSGYIDYEVRSEYVIPVTVSDGKHLDRTTVYITVQNINDHSPEINVLYVSGMKFEMPHQSTQYRALVEENQKPGFVVATFSVSDKDQSSSLVNNPNSRLITNQNYYNNRFSNYAIDCKISGKNDYLELKQLPQQVNDFFKIVTTKEFDREKNSQYFAQLVCYDGGTNSRSTSVAFELTIVDVNDNAPIFKIPSQESRVNPTFTIKEGLPINTLIVRVKAVDKDQGINSNIEYSLDSMSKNFFTIDPLIGEIRSARIFDYEKTQEFELTVNASNPLQSLTSHSNNLQQMFSLKKIFINIEDTNDCPPVFTKDLYNFEIKEGPSKDSYVGRVEVTDNDKSAKFNRNYFKILANNRDFFNNNDPNPSEYFRIGEIGFIYVNVPVLDREKVGSFSFPVVAMDRSERPLSSTALVQIRILDQNDNAPQWIFPSTHSFTVNVSIQEPIGHVVAQLKTKDPDEGENGKVKYRIVAPPYRKSFKNTNGNEEKSVEENLTHDIFDLEGFNSNIIVAQKMGLKDLGPKAIWLEASDQGSPPMKAYERLLIYVVNRQSEYLLNDLSSYDRNYAGKNSVGFNKNGFENDLMIMIVLVAIIILVAMVMVIIILMLRCRNASRAQHQNHHNKLVRDISQSTNLTRSMLERRPDGHSCSPVNELSSYPGPKRSQTISTYLGQSLPGSQQMFDFTNGYLTEPNSRTHLDLQSIENGCDASCQSINRNNFNSNKKYYTSLYRHNNLWQNDASPDLTKRTYPRLNNESESINHSNIHSSMNEFNEQEVYPSQHQNTTKKSVTLPNFLSAIEECEDNNQALHNNNSVSQKPLSTNEQTNSTCSSLNTTPTATSTFKQTQNLQTTKSLTSQELNNMNYQHRLSVSWLDNLWIANSHRDAQLYQSTELNKSVDSCLNALENRNNLSQSTMPNITKDHEYTQLRVVTNQTHDNQEEKQEVPSQINTADYPVTYV